MNLVFKVTPTSPPGKEKISDTDFATHYPGVNMNMMWKEISPFVRQATELYVLPFIGEELYDDIASKIQANAVLSTEQSRFATSLKDSIAYYTIMMALPKKKTVLASMGVVENSADNGTTQSSLWGFKATLWSVIQDADKILDNCLMLLERYLAANVAYFNLWKNSEAFEAGRSEFFGNTKEFQYFHPINNSRRTYISMLPIMRESSAEKILPILCKDLYEQLKTQLRANTLSNENKDLLVLVQKAVAKWTVCYSADALAVLPEQDGFRVITSYDGIDSRTFSTDTIKGAIMGIKEQAENSARTATADLIGFLYSNKDTYPLWRDSVCNKAGLENADKIVCVDDGAVFLG